jgi:hypothetical protein
MRRGLTIGATAAALILGPTSAASAGGLPGKPSPGLAAGLALGAVVLLGLLLWGAFKVGAPPGGREGPKRYS